MNRRHGFTLIELSIVISLSALVVPSLYLHFRNLEGQLTHAQWELDSASAVRTVYEALAADARGGTQTEAGFTLACGTVEYSLSNSTLVREGPEACGGRQALATGVRAITPVPGGVELTLFLELRPDHVQTRVVFLPVVAPQ